MANQCLVLDPPFPFFAFQQQSASSFISRHRIISLSLSQKASTAFQRHHTRARVALEKIQKLSTFTDAEEGVREGGREGIDFPFLKKKKRRRNERITITLFIKDDYRSHGQTALMAILVS